MANGDAAAAAGMDVVPGTSDLRQGYDEINKSRDYAAAHQTTGTHDAAAIASGTLASARIPGLDADKIVSGVIDSSRLPPYPSPSSQANGPTSTAYNRGPRGSGWFVVWMNSSLQFMRNTSSRRYKKNIRNWTGSIAALNPVIFDRRGEDTPNDEVGFIAEEVEQSLPEAVLYFDGKIDGINDRVIITALVAEVQQLLTRVAHLEGSAE